MSLLQQYLRSNCNDGLEELRIRRGVHCNKGDGRHPYLVGFKYSQSSLKSDPLIKLCRGIILDSERNWDIVARPFDRFFNLGEVDADKIDWSTASAYEKLDGTLMMLYYCRDEWCVGTVGSPSANGPLTASHNNTITKNNNNNSIIHNGDMTFCDLFWKTFASASASVSSINDVANLTFLFELIGKPTRVVVLHADEPELILLGARDRSTGQQWLPSQVSRFFDDKFRTPDLLLPAPVNNEQLQAVFARKSPLELEGFVVVDAQFNRVKVKHPGYVTLHHLGTDNILGPRRVMELIKRGEWDEMVATRPDLAVHGGDIPRLFQALVEELEGDWENAKELPRSKFEVAASISRYSDALMAVRHGKASSIRDYLSSPSADCKEILKLIGISDCNGEKKKKMKKKDRKSQAAMLTTSDRSNNDNKQNDWLARCVYGSEDSIDVDVCYFFASMPDRKDAAKFCTDDPSENRNIAVVSHGHIVECFKGAPDELNNSIYQTFALHEQSPGFTCPVLESVQRDVPGKVQRTLMSVLGRCIHDIPKDHRDEVLCTKLKQALGAKRASSRLAFLCCLDTSSLLMLSTADTRKAVAFWLGQALLLLHDVQVFTKSQVCSHLPMLEPALHRRLPVTEEQLRGIALVRNAFVVSCSRLKFKFGDKEEEKRWKSVLIGTPLEGFDVHTVIPTKQIVAAANFTTRLAVFDFDGTLFKSPKPNGKLWGSKMVKKLCSTSNYGWFQHLQSLMPPVVPEVPGDEFYVEETVRDALEALKDPNTRCIVITNRMESVFHGRITQLLRLKQLTFHQICCQQQYSKPEVFRQQLLPLVPNLKCIEIWEDDQEMIEEYKRIAAAAAASAAVVVVTHYITTGSRVLLDSQIEKEFVDSLVLANKDMP